MTGATGSFLFEEYTYAGGKFLVPGESTPKSFSYTGDNSDAAVVLNNFHREIENGIKQTQAKALQDALNQVITDQRDNYQQLVKKMTEDLDKGLLGQIQEEAPGVVTYNGASFSLSEKVAKATKDYDSTLRNLAKQLPHKKKVLPANAELRGVIGQLNGSLNTLRGDIFENILAYILRESGDVMQLLMEKEGDELVNSLKTRFENTLNKNFSEMKESLAKKNIGSKGSTRVTGADLKKTISITIGDKGFKISGSKGKSDVAVPIRTNLSGNPDDVTEAGASDDAMEVGISAKSYGGSKKISLLSQANLAGLISQWETGDPVKNSLALNAFSSRDLWANYRNSKKMEKIFLFQALAGSSKEELLSQLFIVNKNTKKNPYVVFSTYDLLTNGNNISAEINIDAPRRKVPRSRDFFYQFAKETTISVETGETVSKLAANASKITS